jgi:hypothetical protein
MLWREGLYLCAAAQCLFQLGQPSQLCIQPALHQHNHLAAQTAGTPCASSLLPWPCLPGPALWLGQVCAGTRLSLFLVLCLLRSQCGLLMRPSYVWGAAVCARMAQPLWLPVGLYLDLHLFSPAAAVSRRVPGSCGQPAGDRASPVVFCCFHDVACIEGSESVVSLLTP